jgi:hypothetical protein
MPVQLQLFFTAPSGIWRAHRTAHHYGLCLGTLKGYGERRS